MEKQINASGQAQADAHMDLQGRGILYKSTAESKFRMARYLPCEALQPFIRHYWIVEWDLTGQPPYKQEVLQNPVVNFVIEKGQTAIFGIAGEKSHHMLEGRGLAFGVHFLPGGFYPFYGRPVSELTDTSKSLEEVFGCETERLERDILSQPDHAGMIAVLEQFLTAEERLPANDPNLKWICDVVDRMIADSSITKVDQALEGLGMSKRTLQRLFNQYVGVSPKWVIQRYRMLEAAQAAANADTSETVDWPALAAELGFYDQAHFSKAFKALVGVSPESYAKSREQAQ
ncbi:helix-turn-helix domain-containing protein [Paenibacillus sp. NEAU-GSW1]|uniref:helix-turn-helix domain-containing protein n=1 Tax=Paenibacillus sp. NEAU-GSW1 TaxID=2682486 RepID=UPI0012E1A3EE|nr:helix-turn-helix domain-containing protein [Paenibacillus sp. NEAU-GSW1]MUT66524.1 helix-turn-helix domain-containing protein [Paenibacillus sp. NEAU-GSW1]